MNTMRFRLAAKTDMGAVRTNNEDNFQVAADLTSDKMQWINNEVYSLGEKGTLLVVADGMGGMNAGEVASELAIETVREYFSPERLTDEVIKNRYSIEKYMNRVIVEADMRIKREAQQRPETRGMGTTIVIGWVLGGKLYVSWCGDSRAYVYNPVAGLHQISKDHSYVQGLVDKGAISREDAFDYPDSNIITRSLSDGAAKAKPESLLKPYDLCDQDIVLLCTDGLNGMLRDSEIEEVIRNNEVDMDCLADELIKAACEAAGSDNITICLCQILEGGGVCTPDTFESFDNRLAGRLRQDVRISQSDANKTDKWYRKKTYLIIMSAFLLILVGGGCWFWFQNKGENQVEVKATEDKKGATEENRKDRSATDTTDVKTETDDGTQKQGITEDPSSTEKMNLGQGDREQKEAGDSQSVPSEKEKSQGQISGVNQQKKDEERKEPKLTLIPQNKSTHEEEKKEQNESEQEQEEIKSDKDIQKTVKPDSIQTQRYQVKEGETYSSIARKFKTTVEILMKLNHADNTRLNAGDIILVPKN